MEPLRILQVVTIMNRGGLETMLMNYYRQMREKGIQFDFLVHRTEEGHYDREIESLGGRIYRMPPIRPGQYRRYFKRLDEFFADHREYRVVHSHMNENSGFVLRAARKAGVPCRIIHSHLSDLGLDYKYPFRLYARMSIKDHPSDYFACSARAGEWLFGKEVIQSNRFTIMNNAINMSEYSFNPVVRDEVRKQLVLDNNLVIGHVGRFDKQKNHIFLLKVFQNALRTNSHMKLLLVGDGPLKNKIEQIALKMGIRDHILFIGIRCDVHRLMQGIDVLLMPSRFEGLPLVLIEAQAAGVRCVISDRITREVDLTGSVCFLSLTTTIERWSEAVFTQFTDKIRHSDVSMWNNYNSFETAKWLANYYFKRAGLSV